jgi:hypothetical protein
MPYQLGPPGITEKITNDGFVSDDFGQWLDQLYLAANGIDEDLELLTAAMDDSNSVTSSIGASLMCAEYLINEMQVRIGLLEAAPACNCKSQLDDILKRLAIVESYLL